MSGGSPGHGGPDPAESHIGQRDAPAPAGPDPAGPDPAGPDPDLARQRAARAMRGALAAVLSLEALAVLFVPRAIAQFGNGLTAVRLALLLSLAAALLAAAFLLRYPAGFVLGTALQAGLIATGVLTGAMYVVGVLFLAVWLYLLLARRRLLGTGHRVPPADHPR